jgi:Zn-dependent peptidase ImmA (M78 family)
VSDELHDEAQQPRVPSVPSAEVQPSGPAVATRATLSDTFAEQCGWKSPSIALKSWRSAAERQLGVSVFQMQFPREARGTRGFSLPSQSAPVVVLNTAYTEQARIFTLFHEIGHLTLGDSIICDAWRTSNTRSSHERWTESFAANLLLPAKHFRPLVERVVGGRARVTTADVRLVARTTKVSVRAVALRFIDLGLAQWPLYDSVVEETKSVDFKEQKDDSSGGGGERLAEKRLRELGPRLPALLFNAREQDLIAHYDVLKYLDMNGAQARELEGLLAERQA